MRFFVTGATGFLGSHFVRLLIEKGHQVNALVFEPERADFLKEQGAEVFLGGLADEDVLREGMKGCDGVFHCAAFISLNPRESIFYSINVEGTRTVLRVAKEMNIRRVVHTSSLSTIRTSQTGEIADESETVIMDKHTLAYVWSKVESEKIAREFCRDGLEVVIVNPAAILGPEDPFKSETNRLLEHYLSPWKFVSFYVENNWVDVRDVAEGLLLAFEKGTPGERYFLGATNTSANEIFKILDKITGRGLPKIDLGWPITYFIGFFLEFFKNPTVTRGIARYLRYPCWISNEKAKKELGFNPRGLEESLRESVTSYRDYHMKHVSFTPKIETSGKKGLPFGGNQKPHQSPPR